MKLQDLKEYTDSLNNLTKIEVKSEMNEWAELEVTETKETYSFEDEAEADKKINDSVNNPLCSAHSKKYKAGKINKAGEIIKAESWIVVIKLNH